MKMQISSVYKNKFLFFLYILNKRRKVVTITVTLIIVVELLMIYLFSKNEDGHLIIVSTTFYQKSTLYSPNTAVILFNAQSNLTITKKWKCISKDANGKTLISKTIPQFAYPVVPNCAWTTFITNCTTVSNPINFQLSVSGKNTAELELRSAVIERLPVVACFSPLFFNERWQLAAISIESYAASGISRQAYYLMSAIKDVYDLLKIYENGKLIDINLWNLPKHPEARIQLDWRNQGAAHTDCFLKYREAAEFIIISDIDDLLFSRKAFNFYNELKFYASIYPNISSFFYPRFDAEIEAAKSFGNFDIEKSLKSIEISDRLVTGKSVHRTALVETAWLHWAGITKNIKFHKSMNMVENIFVHIRNWKFIDKHFNGSVSEMQNHYYHLSFIGAPFFAILRRLDFNSHPLYPNLTAVAPQNFIPTVTNRFNKRFQKHHEIQSIKSSDLYYDKINECYDEMQNTIKIHNSKHKEPSQLCPTPARCKFFPIANVPCAVTTAHYKTIKLSNNFFVDRIVLESKVVIRKNGCKIN